MLTFGDGVADDRIIVRVFWLTCSYAYVNRLTE